MGTLSAVCTLDAPPRWGGRPGLGAAAERLPPRPIECRYTSRRVVCAGCTGVKCLAAASPVVPHLLPDARVGNAGGVVNDLVRYRDLIADSARWEGFPFRADDIIINTPSKSGTTWMQTLCAMLVFDSVEFGRPLTEISPSLEMQINNRAEVIASLQAQEHRRFIKSHTPLDGVPVAEGVTYVCVTRPPRCRAFVPASPGEP